MYPTPLEISSIPLVAVYSYFLEVAMGPFGEGLVELLLQMFALPLQHSSQGDPASLSISDLWV